MPNLGEREKTAWVSEADVFIDLNDLENPLEKEEEHGPVTQ